MIGLKSNLTTEDAFVEIRRMLREAAASTVFGEIALRITIKHGKPVRIVTAAEVSGEPR